MSWFQGSSLAAAATLACAVAAAAPAGARVSHEGVWPDGDKLVTLDVTAMPRTEALRKLADAAGWSLVVHAPPGDPVEVHVKQAPASKVLDVLLDDGDYVVRRDGNLVSVTPHESADAAAVPPVHPVPPVPPPLPVASATDLPIQIGTRGAGSEAPRGRGKDRTVMGGNVTIAKGEQARDVTVFGGNVDMEGDSTGEVTVIGGNVRVHDGARVHGDATVFGGTLTLDRGARVDGDVSTIGGTLKRDPASNVGGDVTSKGGDSDDGDDGGKDPAVGKDRRGLVARAGASVVDGVRLAAVLFVIGTVLLALSGRRMDLLRAEVAMRPMRAVALGVLGVVGGAAALVALCVTIIGIPVALVAMFVFGFAVLGGMCAVLSVVGEGLLRHRTENPYVHLAVGCALFVALAAIPWVRHLVIVATVLSGIGVLVATRGAGFLRKRSGKAPPSSVSYPQDGAVD